MAVLHKKEEKIQAVLGRLPKKYTHEQFVEMFIKIYSKDWGKIKSAYIKQSQDKEPGTIINMPKPDIYLKQILASYLQQANELKTVEIKEAVAEPKAVEKKVATKKAAVAKELPSETIKVKVPARKKVQVAEKETVEVKETKTTAKKKTDVATEKEVEIKKPKAVAKKAIAKK